MTSLGRSTCAVVAVLVHVPQCSNIHALHCCIVPLPLPLPPLPVASVSVSASSLCLLPLPVASVVEFHLCLCHRWCVSPRVQHRQSRSHSERSPAATADNRSRKDAVCERATAPAQRHPPARNAEACARAAVCDIHGGADIRTGVLEVQARAGGAVREHDEQQRAGKCATAVCRRSGPGVCVCILPQPQWTVAAP